MRSVEARCGDGVTILAAGGGTARLLTEQECKELTRMINFVLRRIEEIRQTAAAVLTFDITLQKIHKNHCFIASYIRH